MAAVTVIRTTKIAVAALTTVEATAAAATAIRTIKIEVAASTTVEVMEAATILALSIVAVHIIVAVPIIVAALRS
jgi:hypothetical protein